MKNFTEARKQRLQRPPDFTGNQLNGFLQVAVRHGLPGALLGLVCLLHPTMSGLLTDALQSALAEPAVYAGAGALILLLMAGFSSVQDRRFDLPRLGWILYLLAVSIWEEWVFRVAIPYFMVEIGVGLRAAVLGSNLTFGLMHYFTLRWKWYWCLLAGLGGMALSRQFHHANDFLLIVAIHWIATFINTPGLPGQSKSG